MLAKTLVAAHNDQPAFGREWAQRGQFGGGSNHTDTIFTSATVANITGLLSALAGKMLTFEFPDDTILNWAVLEIWFGAWTENHAADTLRITSPIRKVTVKQNGQILNELYFADYVSSRKCATGDIRAALASRNVFVDTLTGSQPAFKQTIEMFGMKNYGYSEDASRHHTVVPVPAGGALTYEITFRDQFVMTDGGAGLPTAPLIESMQMYASRRIYENSADFERDMAVMLSPSPLRIRTTSTYSAVKSAAKHFTTDATGGLAALSVTLESLSQQYVSWLTLRVRLATALDESESAVPFEFFGTGSRIEMNGSEFLVLHSSTALRYIFEANHMGRRPTSGYTNDATILDGELFILFSAASMFEMQNLFPQFFPVNSNPSITLTGLEGLAASTEYILDVRAIKMQPLITV